MSVLHQVFGAHRGQKEGGLGALQRLVGRRNLGSLQQRGLQCGAGAAGEQQAVDLRDQRGRRGGQGLPAAEVDVGADGAGHRGVRRHALAVQRGGEHAAELEGRAGIEDAEGRAIQRRVVGQVVVRREEVEHRGRAVHRLAQRGGLRAQPDPIAAAAQGPQQMCQLHDGLAQLAEAGRLGRVQRLGIGQDGAQHGLHVAARLGIEGLGHALHIGGAGVGGDELLDQLAPDEGADIGVVEDVVQRRLQVGARALAAGQHHAVEQLLAAGVVVILEGDHRRVVVARVAEAVAGRAGPRGIGPAGEGVGKALDRVLVVARDRLALAIELLAAIGVELPQADGEQLQHLAGVVLVGLDALGRVGLVVVRHVQIATHRRAQGHLPEHIAEIAEAVAQEDALVVRHRIRQLDDVARHDQDLGQGQRGALAQLVGLVDRVREELHLHRKQRVVVAPASGPRTGWAALGGIRVDVGHAAEVRVAAGELAGQPGLAPQRHQLGHARVGRAEAGLAEQPSRVGFSHLGGGLGGVGGKSGPAQAGGDQQAESRMLHVDLRERPRCSVFDPTRVSPPVVGFRKQMRPAGCPVSAVRALSADNPGRLQVLDFWGRRPWPAVCNALRHECSFSRYL
mmetsp:Transcript_5553/g.21325  ORF Transcript_5553/g.21325 Transcript_5553/m.21325 type:complete len:622 (-) Transcript_5553:134-1999(-)